MKPQFTHLNLASPLIILVLFFFTEQVLGLTDLDNQFGTAGSMELNLSQQDTLYDIEVDQNGDIYLLGSTQFESDNVFSNLFVTKMDSNGVIDQNFGGWGGAPAGTAVADFQLQWDRPGGIGILDDSRIVTVRHSPMAGWVLMMFTPDGKLDYSFGSSGKKSLYLFGDDAPRDLAIVDGNILIWSALRIAKLDLEGDYVASFGVDGVLDFENELGEPVVATSVVYMNDDILVNSYQYLGFIEPPGDVRVFSLNQNGNLNLGFGIGGVIAKPNPANQVALGLAYNNDKLTIGVGNKVMRFDTAGVDDSTFGVNGTVDLGINVTVEEIIHQSYGTTTVALNWNGLAFANEFIAARLTNRGDLDSTFGNQNGYHRQSLGQSASTQKVIGYSNGSVLIGGYFRLPGNGAPRNVMLLRTEAWGGIGGGGFGGGFQINNRPGTQGLGGFTNGN